MTLYVRSLATAPAARLGLYRMAVGTFLSVYLLARLPQEIMSGGASPAQFDAVGLCAWLGMTAPLVHFAAITLHVLSIAAAFAFTLGWHFNVSGPTCALLVLWVTSYKSSFGMLFHSENLVTLHTLLIGCSPAAQAVSVDTRHGRSSWLREVPSGWPLLACGLVAICVYALAGIAKLKLSGLDFASGEVLRVQIAYDNVRKLEFGSSHAPLGVWSISQPLLFPVLGVVTLLAELGGPLALLHRRVAQIWVALIVGFHWGVLALMDIAFFYPLSAVPFFFASLR